MRNGNPRSALVALLGLCVVVLSACALPAAGAAPAPDVSGRRIRAVATTGMVADVVKNVGGERVEVRALMGAGVDPHLYKASEGDVRRIGSADIVFYSGLHLEARMGEVLERMEGRVRAVAITDGIDRALLTKPAEFEGQYDPHVWFDVSMWMQTVPTVRDALIALDPGSESIYRANAERYHAELADLDQYARTQLQTIPEARRVLITAHDAFNYFGRAYGLQVRGLQGISTAAEAGTRDVQDLAAFIAEQGIPAVFIESSVPERTVQAVVAAVRARGTELRVGGELFSDAMGTEGTVEGTYVGMVKHNVGTIVEALR